VDHGRTGFIVDSVDQMAKALLDVDTINPETWRQIARARFSAQSMAVKYLDLYEQLIENQLREQTAIANPRISQWHAIP
jgi:glycosyltransferase involved in cell wall biosynthesis